MRIACMGNTNHNMFSLVRHLRERGLNAELLVFNTEIENFHPANDTFDLEYEKYTRILDWGDQTNFINIKPTEILEELEPYDFLIGCGPAPAYLHKAGRVLDVFSPYGSDLYEMTAYKYQRVARNIYKNFLGQIDQYQMINAQRSGIKTAHYILNNNEKWSPYYPKLGFKGEHLKFPIPQIYMPPRDPDSTTSMPVSPPALAPLRQILEGYEVSIFHGSRHVWSGFSDQYAHKGNERLVRGFAQYLNSSSATHACLIMCEYGPDVQKTKHLVNELGVSEHVIWLRKLRRKDILMCLELVDLVACEFEISWLGGGTLYEALAMGKPIMQYRDDQLYEADYEELPQILNCREPDEISESLQKFANNAEYYAGIGEKGRDWYCKHVQEPTLKVVSGLFK